MIAGPNGAGKTTSAMTLLPDILTCDEYINADSIAVGLSPFKPEEVAFAAGRLMLERIHQLAKRGADFAFETTGASRTFAPFLMDCKNDGYEINLLYVWLVSPELALERVATRVANGGHDIPEDVVRRRYKKGLENLLKLYMPVVDNWMLYNNSGTFPELIAERSTISGILIVNQDIWQMLNRIKL